MVVWWSMLALWEHAQDAEAGPAPDDEHAVWHLVAGASPDDGREREFFRRFLHVSRDLGAAPGHLVSLVHVPADAPGPGHVLTFSVWRDLAAGLDWAYGSSRPHTSAGTRQRAHRLVEASGSLRCAVRSSRGALGDGGNPLGP